MTVALFRLRLLDAQSQSSLARSEGCKDQEELTPTILARKLPGTPTHDIIGAPVEPPPTGSHELCSEMGLQFGYRPVAVWEMPVAVLLAITSVYGMARLAAAIYSTALVRGGARLGWRAALRLRKESGIPEPEG